MDTLPDQLRKLIPPTRKLLLYNNWSDADDFDMCLERTKLTIDQLLETKCSTTKDALMYLFDFHHTKYQTLNKAIIITLQGYVGDKLSDTGHVLTIIPSNGTFLIDSYYSCRGLVITPIDENTVLSTLEKLEELTVQFTPSLWQDITGCPYIPDGTEVITLEIAYNDFNTNHVKQRFKDLVTDVLNKIQTALELETTYTVDEIIRNKELRYVYNNLSDDKIMYLLSERVQTIDDVILWLKMLQQL